MMIIIQEVVGSLVIRYIHFFSSIMWWGMMFFMFIIIFPTNKDNRYSTLFPRVQRFMKVIASIALASGIVLTLMNTKFTIERLFSTNWGYTILTGATISIFVYIHILMQNRRGGKTTTTTTAATASSSSLLVPSKSTLLRKDTKNTIINNSQKERYQNGLYHGYSSCHLQLRLH
jgi:putative copper export protein